MLLFLPELDAVSRLYFVFVYFSNLYYCNKCHMKFIPLLQKYCCIAIYLFIYPKFCILFCFLPPHTNLTFACFFFFCCFFLCR